MSDSTGLARTELARPTKCHDCGKVYAASEFSTNDRGFLVLKHTCNGVMRQFVQSGRSGTLLPVGSHDGNTGGKAGRSGPLPSSIRGALRQALEDRIPSLIQIADDPKCAPGERIKAIELLARYGLGARSQIALAPKLPSTRDRE
jgi:uncharacterized membrane protein